MSEEIYKRVELTGKQKEWVRTFWTWVGTTFMGFKTPAIPDLIPRFTPDGRTMYVPAIEPHIHHQIPIGTATRVLHNPNYNIPQNLVPISARLHVGKGVKEGDDDEELVIHPDQMEFLREYGDWKRRGETGESPMDALQRKRREMTLAGLPYHNVLWDSHFREITDRYLNEYQFSHPELPWPKKITRTSK